MFVSAFRSRRHLLLENLALRAARHLGASATPSHPARRPSLLGRPSAVVVWLGGRLVIVKPETVIRWHRAGLRLYWRWLSRRGKQGGRPACRQRSARLTWAWCSLFGVAFADLYVRLCSMGTWSDWRIL